MYGFAGGDPVNFSDPFGLCPLEKDGIPCAVTMGVGGALVGAGTGALAGAAAGTLVVPGVGTLVGAGGGAVGLGLAGAIAGTIGGAAQDAASLAAMSGLGDKIRRKVHDAIETVGLIIGFITMEPPPKKPEDDDLPPPPAATSPKAVKK